MAAAAMTMDWRAYALLRLDAARGYLERAPAPGFALELVQQGLAVVGRVDRRDVFDQAMRTLDAVNDDTDDFD